VGFSRLYSVIGRVTVSLQPRKKYDQKRTQRERERDADQEALANTTQLEFFVAPGLEIGTWVIAQAPDSKNV
jgi:hypothetical protein